jgi:Na+/proline symporter
MIMAAVCLAGIKIGGILFDLAPWEAVVYASVITVLYSSLGGLRGVIFTDFLQFIVAMIGSIWAAYYVLNLPEVGGLEALLTHENVVDKLNFLPDFNDRDTLWTLLLIPIAVQWWSVWYPGAEPGGGGYVAQRMLSAKNERNAVGATLLFNITHYALRPWPWIIIALASLVVYPELSDIKAAFPNATEGHDLGYSAMLTYLPPGLLGLVVSSLIAAFMSTISTHLNWGSSYIALDFYKRFVRPEATEKQLVWVGRWSTVFLMILAGILALQFESALDTFNILLQIGAGTGLIFILRWFWWRINAYSEITGMVVSFVVALAIEFFDFGFDATQKLLWGVGITTLSWILVTLITRPTEEATLIQFYNKIIPYGSGWNGFKHKMKARGIELNTSKERFSSDLLLFLLGVVVVYCVLFGTGYVIYGQWLGATVLITASLMGTILMFKIFKNRTAR